MKRFSILFIAYLLVITQLKAQEKQLLYPDQANLSIGGANNIPDPPYFVYYPCSEPGIRPAILICPGGGYTVLAADHEGKAVAEFFNQQGYDAFILMYRLNKYDQTGSRFPAEYDDVTTAMILIRSNAEKFQIDPEKLGIIGFSAGGHLASMCATMFKTKTIKVGNTEKVISTRPSFAILIYPVISLVDSFAHMGSAEMLTGKNPRPGLRDSLSTYKRVTIQTPPTFLVYANDDKVVPPENGISFYQALRRNGIAAQLHIYDHGGHGFGLAPKDPVLNTWPTLAVEWLKRIDK